MKVTKSASRSLLFSRSRRFIQIQQLLGQGHPKKANAKVKSQGHRIWFKVIGCCVQGEWSQGKWSWSRPISCFLLFTYREIRAKPGVLQGFRHWGRHLWPRTDDWQLERLLKARNQVFSAPRQNYGKEPGCKLSNAIFSILCFSTLVVIRQVKIFKNRLC